MTVLQKCDFIVQIWLSCKCWLDPMLLWKLPDLPLGCGPRQRGYPPLLLGPQVWSWSERYRHLQGHAGCHALQQCWNQGLVEETRWPVSQYPCTHSRRKWFYIHVRIYVHMYTVFLWTDATAISCSVLCGYYSRAAYIFLESLQTTTAG